MRAGGWPTCHFRGEFYFNSIGIAGVAAERLLVKQDAVGESARVTLELQ